MRDFNKITSFMCSQNESSYLNQENRPSHGIENVSIIIVNKKRLKNRKKHNVLHIQAQQSRVAFRLSRFSKSKKQSSITESSSMPDLNKCTRSVQPRNRSDRGKNVKKNKFKQSPFQSNFIVNVVSEHRFDECLNPFNYPRQPKLKIYRCQLGGVEDSCCCSCNSDAMFEVMKSLYDCYKKKNCDNCQCILCGHLAREDRLSAKKKSLAALSEQEKLLRAQAMKGLPLPEGKTASEKKLINKVRTDLGVPIEPKTKAIRDKHEKAAQVGLLFPLEGKTPAEKEKLLKGQHNMGIPLPKGRTPSEKSLIAKIEAGSPHPSKFASAVLTPSDKISRAKMEGLLTPLKGKSPEKKEKFLKALAKKGKSLPEGQSPSEKKLIDKVRTDLGLPIEPKNKSIRDKHAQAAKEGLLQPLEGKTPAEKAKLLKGQHDMGIPLPKGRTPSEKALIAKIAAGSRHPSKVASAVLAPSERLRRAKADGLLTSLKGKSPEDREKILKALANRGIPLPEGQSPSEKKLINKVRTELGLPIEPKTKDIRNKHEKAALAGLLYPLEGKTPAEKEKLLRGQHNMGIPLPVGRTPSEKSLIAKITAGSLRPSKVASAFLTPSEQMRRAKADGLLTSLKGKSPEDREKILKALANRGIPLPEGQSPSEKKIINKVRADLGLPIEPKTKDIRNKHEKAALAGLLYPLEGKTAAEKEKLLRGQHNMGIPLPVGRTPSEKSLIAKIVAGSLRPSKAASAPIALSEKIRKAKAEGLFTPLKGKTPREREDILRALANRGIPLPEGQSPSEKKLIDKVRADLGLPIEPKTKDIRNKHEKAALADLLYPLEGKTLPEKEKLLRGQHSMGIPLPVGRTPSEKSLIAKITAGSLRPSKVASAFLTPSEQMRRAKADGLLTSLKGKSPEVREKILKALANRGIPLPEGQSPSEKKLINKVRTELGLPIEPKTKDIRNKHEKAALAGLLYPLEGKTLPEKEKLLRGQHSMGIPLPVGRTPSEKSLIAKITAGSLRPSKVASTFLTPSEQMRRAKADGLLTSLKGKSPEDREKILKALANRGIPLPEGQSPSEKKLINKVRTEVGLPIEPKTKDIRNKHEKAALAGLLYPLEGKTLGEKEKLLRGQHSMGIPLPVGRTPSEKSLIAKITAGSLRPSKVASAFLTPSEQMRRAKADGLLTSLKGKSPGDREKILKALANRGIPLPEGQSPSEKKLINKVRTELGLPIEPKTKDIRNKHEKAALAGLLYPLEGKTLPEKEKLLRGQHSMGIPLPVGRTPSEKSLIAKITAGSLRPSKVASTFLTPSEQMRRAKADGLLTSLKGKSPEDREKILKALANRGIPLPEGQSPSEKKLINKVRTELGLPIEPKTKDIRNKHEKAALAGLLYPLEGKTLPEKEKLLRGQHSMGIPLPVGRTPSEKSLIAKIVAGSLRPSKAASAPLALSEKIRKSKSGGLVTPLKGKTPEEREKILKALAMRGIPLPEGQSPSEKKLINKVRADIGLPIEPKTKDIRNKHENAALAGLLYPLEGKTLVEKEKLLRGQHSMGIPLPVGRTPSEKSLIAKVKAASRAVSAILSPSEQMRRTKAEGLLTSLKDQTAEQREKNLRALANRGLPLPEGQSLSEKNLINKVRADLGLPIEPKNKSIRDKHNLAAKAGLLRPLEGKTPAQKEKLLRGQHNMGIPLPVGRTPSEKSLIAKIAASSRHPSKVASAVSARSEQMRRAKAEGLLTPLKGKSPEDREKILRALANRGIPLPEGQSPSEKKLINKVRADLGLPIEPKTKAIRDKHEKAALAGLLLPLEGKTSAQKEKILRGQHNMGIPLPVGRTPSEKSLIAKVIADSRPPWEGKIPSKAISAILAPSEHMSRAKAEGLLTPLKGKPPEQRENILKALAMRGIPLPEGQSLSEKKLIHKVRTDLGLPVEPKTKVIRDKHEKAALAGLLFPLEGKTLAQKEKILRGQHSMGIPLPVGRTPSEKSLIAKITADRLRPSKVASTFLAPSEQMRRAKAEGLLTPLKGKSPEDREKILKALANRGIPLPEGQSPSEKKLINKVRADLGLPIEPKTKAIRNKHEKAALAGLLYPLQGKTLAVKEKLLRGQHNMGIPLPVGRTPSEKSLIAKIAAGSLRPSKVASAPIAVTEKIRKGKAEGLVTPLKGKTPEEREDILRALANRGIPLPEGQSPSEKKLINKVRADLGLPIEPKTKAIRDKHEKAALAGLLYPLEGKTTAEKEKLLRGQHNMGIPLPVGRTPSEKSLIAKIAAGSLHSSKVASASEGILSPLKDKTPEEREKILKALAMRGIPLPEGQSPSEKKLIEKVRADLGLPIEPKTKAIRDKHEQAAIVGKLLPLEGKTPAEKEKILQNLHDMGIPLPVGRTASEKSLIARIMAGPKGKSKISIAASKRLAEAKGVGIAAEFQDIVKTTTCDRGCGCDKKKIRFKHSYVKIRVTSPDISSFCDCPYECIPGVKNGAFIDNEGIKVTVGRAVGVSSFTRAFCTKTDNSNTLTKQTGLKDLIYSKHKVSRSESGPCFDSVNYSLNSFGTVDSSCARPYSTESVDTHLQSSTPPYEGRTSKSDRTVDSLRRYQPFDDHYKGLNTKTKSTVSSLGSVLVIKSEMSLCSTSTSKSMDTVSLISSMDSSITNNSTHYSGYQSSDDPVYSSLDESTTSGELIDYPATIGEGKILRNIRGAIAQHEYTVLRMSQTKLNFGNSNIRTSKLNSETEEPIVLLNQLPSKLDVSKIMDKIMSKKRFVNASNIFIVVPMSDDDEAPSSANVGDSITNILPTETSVVLNDTSQKDQNPALRTTSFTKHDEQVCRKGKKFYMQEITSSETMFGNVPLVLRRIGRTKDEFCQISTPNEIAQMLKKAAHGVGSDTTADRPSYSCCHTQYSTPFVIQNCNSKDRYAANVKSRQKTPLLLQDGSTPNIYWPMRDCNLEIEDENFDWYQLLETRTPSPVSSVMSCELSRQPTVGSCRMSHNNSFPDMRTPSPVSSLQGSSYFSGTTFGSGRLPDMRTPSTASSDLPVHAPTRHSAGPSHVPHAPPDKATSCCRFRDMRTPSTDSLHLPRQVPTSHSVGSSLFSRTTFGSGRLPDMRTPSTASSDLPVHAPTHHSAGASHVPHPPPSDKATSCCRIRDMRTPSTESLDLPRQVPTSHSVGSSQFSGVPSSSLGISLDQPCNSSSVVGPSPSTNRASNRCCLPDMRTPSTISLAIPRESRTYPSVLSGQFPSKTSDCSGFPDMRTPSTISVVLQCKVSSPCGVIWSCHFPSETYSCCHLPALRTRSSKSIEHMCEIPACDGSHVTLHDSRLPQNMHKYPEQTSNMPCCACNPSKAKRPPKKSACEGSPTTIDYTKKETCMHENSHRRGPSQRRAIQESCLPKVSTAEDACFCAPAARDASTKTNELSSRQPYTPKVSFSGEDCVCQGVNRAYTLSDETAKRQPRDPVCEQPHLQANQQPRHLESHQDSQLPSHQARQHQRYHSRQKPRDQTSQQPHCPGSRQSKMPKYCDSEENCFSEDKVETDKITSQQPGLRSSQLSDMPEDSASVENCILCEDVDDAVTKTDKIPSRQCCHQESQQPRHQESQQPRHQKRQWMRHQASEQPRYQESQQPRYQKIQQPHQQKSQQPCHHESQQPSHHESQQRSHQARQQPCHHRSQQPNHHKSQQRSNCESQQPPLLENQQRCHQESQQPRRQKSQQPCNHDSQQPSHFKSQQRSNCESQQPRYQESHRPRRQKSQQPCHHDSQQPPLLENQQRCHQESQQSSHQGSQQPCYPGSRQSKMLKDSDSEENCFCELCQVAADIITDKITSQQPGLRSSQLSDMPEDSACLENCILCEDVDDAVTKTDEITTEQCCHQESQQPSHQSSELPCHQASQQPRNQSSRHPNMLKDSASILDCYCEDINDADTLTDELKNQPPRLRSSQRPRYQSSRHPYMPQDSARGLDCYCEDINDAEDTITNEITSQQPCLQAYRQSKMPKDATSEHDYICESVMAPESSMSDDADTITDEITSLHPQFQSSQQSRYQSTRHPDMLEHSTRVQDYNCDDIDNAEDTITNEIIRQQPCRQAYRQSKMLKEHEHDYICESVMASESSVSDDADTITDEITSLHPQFQSSQQSRCQSIRHPDMLEHSTIEQDYNCDDIDDAEDTITNEITRQQPCRQAYRQSKMPKEHEHDYICESVMASESSVSDDAHTITDEITSQQTRLWSSQELRLQASKKVKNLECSAGKKDIESKGIEGPSVVTDKIGTRDPCFQATRKSKMLQDFAVKKKCACQQKRYASCGFRVREDTEARHMLRIPPEQIQHQPEVSAVLQSPAKTTKKSKVSKIISSIRKSISHKIDETPIDPKDPKPNTKEPKTRKTKEEKVICECNKVKTLCMCDGEKAVCECGKEEKVFCECSKVKPTTSQTKKIPVQPKSVHSAQTMPDPTESQNIPPGAAVEVIYDGYPYEHNCGWIDIVELMRLRSELTESTSGFKACKKRKQQQRTNDVILEEPVSEIELNFEDAIKYYVGKNLELFRDILPPRESDQEMYQGKEGQKLLKEKRAKARKEREKAQKEKEKARKKAEKARKKAKKKGKVMSEDSDEDEKSRIPKDSCQCPYGRPRPEISCHETFTPEDSEELAKLYPKGMKFCIGGTGLSPVLAKPAVASTSARAGEAA